MMPFEAVGADGTDSELAGRRLLILGAGQWQREYIRRARCLGLETWVTDWSPSAVARSEADHFEPIDLKDMEATLAFARSAHVHGVFTAADIGVRTAAYVAEQLSLPGHSVWLADQATNKLKMRRQSELSGIACPWYRSVRSAEEGAAAVGDAELPVIVKPIDNCSSRGVRWVGRRSDVAAAVATAFEASLAGEALIEQFLVGAEGSIEALVDNGRPIVLGACDKTKSPMPYRYDLELRYPGAYDTPIWQQIDLLVERIVRGFRIQSGILHIEFLVSAGTVYLIEFAIRGCGSNVVTHLMPALTGIDVVKVVIRQAFGLTTPVEKSRAKHGVLHFLMFPPGSVRAVRGVEAARRVPGVIEVSIERGPGEEIGEVRDGRSRPGHILAWGDSRAGVQRTLAEARALIRLDYQQASDVAPLGLPDWQGPSVAGR
jgi:biotin carboxylase